MGKKIKLSGKTFGDWLVISDEGKVKDRAGKLVKCKCGTEQTVLTSNLISGKSTCCMKCRNTTKQGDSKPKSTYYGLYTSHANMMARCYYTKDKCYAWYGAKGVVVHLEWHSYIIFKQWALSNGWRKGLVLGRFKDIGNYSPTNVSWITKRKNLSDAHLGKINNWRLLTTKDVKFIREQDLSTRSSGMSIKDMADKFNVSKANISAIRSRVSYKDIE